MVHTHIQNVIEYKTSEQTFMYIVQGLVTNVNMCKLLFWPLEPFKNTLFFLSNSVLNPDPDP
jgi:hypothetical protein